MPPVHRVGDICTGHGCWPPRTAIPSPLGMCTVISTALPIHLVGDWYMPHHCPGSSSPPHTAMGLTGAMTVIASFRPVRRIGDVLTTGGAAPLGPCFGYAITGSPNVWAGM